MKMKAAAVPVIPLERTSSSETDSLESPRSTFESCLAEAKGKLHDSDSDEIKTTITKASDDTPEVRPIITVTTIKAVGVSSAHPESPAFQGTEFTTHKRCHKLKSRIFKCHKRGNVEVTDPNSGLTGEEGSAMDQLDETEVSSQFQEMVQPVSPERVDSTDLPKVGGRLSAFLHIRRKVTDSPRSLEPTDSPRFTTDSPRKRVSFNLRRRPIPKSPSKESELDDTLSAPSATESEIEEALSEVVADSEISAEAVNDKKDAAAAAVHVAGGETKVSRIRELRMAIRNFKKRYKAAENLPTPDDESQRSDVAAVKEFDQLPDSVNHQTNTTLANREEKKKKSSLLPKCDFDRNPASSSKTIIPNSTLTIAQSTSLSRTSSAGKSTFINNQPQRPKVTNLTIPARGSEVRSVLDSEISGTFMVLAILGFLLVGKTTAILGTALLCIVISRVQQLRLSNMTPRQREALGLSTMVGATGLSRFRGSPGPLHSDDGDGSPAVDIYSSEYRKKVLLEGFLDRGNRRGS